MTFLKSSIIQFKSQKSLAEKAISQINDEAIHHQSNEDENSIAMIIHHMSGNMMSRWSNIFTEDGEKPWRDRDKEFEPNLFEKEKVLQLWEKGWNQLFMTLESLSENDLQREIYIRNQVLTVEDAIIRQLCHYSHHCGQILYKCKQLTQNPWKSLSIAKDASKVYNNDKFSKEKGQDRFLDTLLEKKE